MYGAPPTRGKGGKMDIFLIALFVVSFVLALIFGVIWGAGESTACGWLALLCVLVAVGTIITVIVLYSGLNARATSGVGR